jgi:hypothetical protein
MLATSYWASRRAAENFYRGSEDFLEPYQIALSLRRWAPEPGPAYQCDGIGIWKAWACERSSICCSFAGGICLSAWGKVVKTWPNDLEKRLAEAMERRRSQSESREGLPNKALNARRQFKQKE